MLRDQYVQITKSIYLSGVNADSWNSTVYDSNGDPVSFFIKDIKKINIGFIHNKDPI